MKVSRTLLAPHPWPRPGAGSEVSGLRQKLTGAQPAIFTLRIWLALLASFLLAACGPAEPLRQESYVFGTRVEILIADSGIDAAAANAASGAALREFDRLHRQYHAWQSSPMTQLNDALAAGQPHQVSAEFADLLRQAQAMAAAGDHLFDPGIGRLVALWGFHSDEIQPRLPPAADIERLRLARPSIADIAIDGTQISSRNREVALDFGGYLKGVALDRAAAILKSHGIRNALINIGGNVLALGSKRGMPWRVGIQHPRAATVGNVPLASLELFDGEAIGTSGDYHRYFEFEGKRYCHLLDPRSGQPASATQALTILIPPGPQAGTHSDAYSKPIFIAAANWRAMAARLGIAAVLRIDASGTAFATPAMQARLRIEAPDIRLNVVE